MNEQQPGTENDKSKNMTVVIVLIVGAVLAFAIFSNRNTGQEQALTEDQQKKLESAEGEIKEAGTAAKDAAATAKSNIEQAGSELASETAEVKTQTCLNTLETSKTQKALLEKNITAMKKVMGAVDNNMDEAIEICRYVNDGLSDNECSIKIDNKTVEAEGSIAAMETKIKELDKAIATGC